jgi:hypothetical protein
MDPHDVRVDLEPPLNVVRLGPAMTAGARRSVVRVEEPPSGMNPCRRAGRAPPRSRSTVAHPPIGGRARQWRGLQRCHHLPRFAHRRWSLTGRPPRFAWSHAVHERESGSEEREWWVLGFHPERRFWSAGNNAQSSIPDERLVMTGPKSAQVRKWNLGPGPRRGLRAVRATAWEKRPWADSVSGPFFSYEQ